MSAVVLFGASGFLLYRLFVFRHFIGVNVEYPAILLLMMAIITCSVAWIGWRTAKSMHQIHVIIVSLVTTSKIQNNITMKKQGRRERRRLGYNQMQEKVVRPSTSASLLLLLSVANLLSYRPIGKCQLQVPKSNLP